jgi:hypothetical protein
MKPARIYLLSIAILMIPYLLHPADDERSSLKKEEVRTKEKSMAVFIDYGNGYIDIGGIDTKNIFEAELVYSEYRPEMKYEIIGDEGHLDIRFSGKVKRDDSDKKGKSINSLDNLYDNELILSIHREIPVTLNLDLGVVKGNLNLSGLSIKEIDMEIGVSKASILFDQPNPIRMESFDIEGGVGKLSIEKLANANFDDFFFEGGVGSYEIDFTGKYTHDMRANIEMGMGKMTLYLPKYIGTRVQIDKSFLSSVSIDDVYKRGEVYYNHNWEKTQYGLDLLIEAGIGKVDIVWVDE